MRLSIGFDSEGNPRLAFGERHPQFARYGGRGVDVVPVSWLTSNEAFEVAWRGAKSCGVGKVSAAQLTAALNALSEHLGNAEHGSQQP